MNSSRAREITWCFLSLITLPILVRDKSLKIRACIDRDMQDEQDKINNLNGLKVGLALRLCVGCL